MLRQAQLRQAMTEQALAMALGASLPSLKRWLDGSASPSPEQLLKITDLALGDGSDGAKTKFDPFASTGARKRVPMGDAGDIARTPGPGAPVLARLSDGDWLRTSAQVGLAQLLDRHKRASETAARTPSAGMSAGKNTYTYDAHTYHTKVPPQGIAELLRHYLPEGGLVLDPFAGSGMTGVAAATTGSDCVLNELSPAASFLCSRFTSRVPSEVFGAAVGHILTHLAGLARDLYTTDCRECGKDTELLYMVWSYRVVCPSCSTEFQLWDVCRKYGRTVREHKILSEFSCPSCVAPLKKSTLRRTAAEPVQIGYKCCGGKSREVNHPPSARDLALIEDVAGHPPVPGYFPEVAVPDGVNLGQPKRHGFTTIRSFYTPRALSALSNIWYEIHRIEEPQLAAQVAFAFTSLYRRVTKLSEFRFWGGSGNSARLNVPYIFEESNVFHSFARKARTIQDHLETTALSYTGDVAVHMGSATKLDWLADESVDLVFTDPPFGANINYSEMNLLWESWLGRFTDATDEAIVNRVQGKDLGEYARLMKQSLDEIYRVLRPGHWMLMVFMNSSAKVWEALRDAIAASGLVLVAADIFDKQHGTFKHYVSENTPGADLVLHCLKPIADEGSAGLREASGKSLLQFLESRDLTKYRQDFLHVARAEETDYRRLYSDWLCEAVLQGMPVIDFSAFRAAVADVIPQGSD